MAGKPKPSILVPILVAAVLTLIVSVARLVSEINAWGVGEWTQPGGASAWLGIVWLVPVFGFWFGRRLSAVGHGPKSTAHALILPLVGLAAVIGLAAFAASSEADDVLRSRLSFVLVGAPLASLCVILAWPRAFLATLAYGVLARTPVIVIQFVAIAQEWGSHYEKAHPRLEPMTPDERGFTLMIAQLALWIPFTVLAGSLCAALGSLTVRRR